MKKERHGFTLIEIVVACAVSVIFLMSFLAMFRAMTGAHNNILAKSNDTLTAQNMMERLQPVPFASLESSAGVEVSELSTDLKTIKVTYGKTELYSIRSRYR